MAKRFLEVDARGRMRRVLEDNNLYKDIKNLPVLPGNNLRLTLDRDLQIAAYNALEGKGRQCCRNRCKNW